MPEFDSPWKEALDDLLQLFLKLFLPNLERRIDWRERPESLDNELAKLFPDSAAGKGIVDRLFKVRLLDGTDVWVLIHIEVQSQRDDDFPGRLFRYFYRLRDKFDLPLMCLVILADESPSWRPRTYRYRFEGTGLVFRFPTIKLLDFRDRLEELENSENPFALFVLAHLQSQAASAVESRFEWKRRITHNLLARELDEEQRWKVLKLIDWLLDLPVELNDLYWNEIREWKERQTMPFVTGLEKMLMKEWMNKGKEDGLNIGREEGEKIGLLKGLKLGLQLKFPENGEAFFNELQSIADIEKLNRVHEALFLSAKTIEDLRKLLS